MSVSEVDGTLPNFTYLHTTGVRVVRPSGLSKLTRCVLDSGSQTSLISTSIIGALKLEVIDQRNLAVGAFESPSITSSSRRLLRLNLRGFVPTSARTITAFESAYDFLPQTTVPHDVNGMTLIPKIQLSEPRDSEDVPIEILVGSDHYWKIVKDSPPWRISPSLVLLPSRLGWILSGNRSVISVNVAAVNFFT